MATGKGDYMTAVSVFWWLTLMGLGLYCWSRAMFSISDSGTDPAVWSTAAGVLWIAANQERAEINNKIKAREAPPHA